MPNICVIGSADQGDQVTIGVFPTFDQKIHVSQLINQGAIHLKEDIVESLTHSLLI